MDFYKFVVFETDKNSSLVQMFFDIQNLEICT